MNRMPSDDEDSSHPQDLSGRSISESSSDGSPSDSINSSPEGLSSDNSISYTTSEPSTSSHYSPHSMATPTRTGRPHVIRSVQTRPSTHPLLPHDNEQARTKPACTTTTSPSIRSGQNMGSGPSSSHQPPLDRQWYSASLSTNGSGMHNHQQSSSPGQVNQVSHTPFVTGNTFVTPPYYTRIPGYMYQTPIPYEAREFPPTNTSSFHQGRRPNENDDYSSPLPLPPPPYSSLPLPKDSQFYASKRDINDESSTIATDIPSFSPSMRMSTPMHLHSYAPRSLISTNGSVSQISNPHPGYQILSQQNSGQSPTGIQYYYQPLNFPINGATTTKESSLENGIGRAQQDKARKYKRPKWHFRLTMAGCAFISTIILTGMILGLVRMSDKAAKVDTITNSFFNGNHKPTDAANLSTDDNKIDVEFRSNDIYTDDIVLGWNTEHPTPEPKSYRTPVLTTNPTPVLTTNPTKYPTKIPTTNPTISPVNAPTFKVSTLAPVVNITQRAGYMDDDHTGGGTGFGQQFIVNDDDPFGLGGIESLMDDRVKVDDDAESSICQGSNCDDGINTVMDDYAQFVDDVASDVDLGVDNSELDDDPIVKWTVEEGGENRDDESNGGWDDGFDDQVADDFFKDDDNFVSKNERSKMDDFPTDDIMNEELNIPPFMVDDLTDDKDDQIDFEHDDFVESKDDMPEDGMNTLDDGFGDDLKDDGGFFDDKGNWEDKTVVFDDILYSSITPSISPAPTWSSSPSSAEPTNNNPGTDDYYYSPDDDLYTDTLPSLPPNPFVDDDEITYQSNRDGDASQVNQNYQSSNISQNVFQDGSDIEGNALSKEKLVEADTEDTSNNDDDFDPMNFILSGDDQVQFNVFNSFPFENDDPVGQDEAQSTTQEQLDATSMGQENSAEPSFEFSNDDAALDDRLESDVNKMLESETTPPSSNSTASTIVSEEVNSSYIQTKLGISFQPISSLSPTPSPVPVRNRRNTAQSLSNVRNDPNHERLIM